MANRNFLFLTAFLAESEDGTLSHLAIVFDPLRNDRPDASKGIS